jgi:hypothetical protein
MHGAGVKQVVALHGNVCLGIPMTICFVHQIADPKGKAIHNEALETMGIANRQLNIQGLFNGVPASAVPRIPVFADAYLHLVIDPGTGRNKSSRAWHCLGSFLRILALPASTAARHQYDLAHR